jgi:arylsulfatase
MELTLGEIPFDRRDLWYAYQNYYWNCMRDVDRQLGRVLDGLEASGQLDDTLIVYTADHGEMAGVHGLREKSGVPYREVSNIPLWIRHPDIAGDHSSDVLASMIDIVPTLLSGAGVNMKQLREQHPELTGIDLTVQLGRTAAANRGERRQVLFQWTSLVHVSADLARFFAGIKMARTPEERAQAAAGGPPDLTPYRGHMRGIYDGRWKFARYFSPKQHHTPETFAELVKHNDLELYDTLEDPGETLNLAAEVSDPIRDKIERMNRELNKLVEREIGVDDGGHLPGPEGSWTL